MSANSGTYDIKCFKQTENKWVNGLSENDGLQGIPCFCQQTFILPLFSRELSLYFYYHLYLQPFSFSLFLFSFFSLLLLYSSNYQLSLYLLPVMCAHISIFVNRSEQKPPAHSLFILGSSDCSRTVPRLTSIHLSGQSIPPIKLVEQADLRRSKFWQFAYIFPSTKAKLLS